MSVLTPGLFTTVHYPFPTVYLILIVEAFCSYYIAKDQILLNLTGQEPVKNEVHHFTANLGRVTGKIVLFA